MGGKLITPADRAQMLRLWDRRCEACPDESHCQVGRWVAKEMGRSFLAVRRHLIDLGRYIPREDSRTSVSLPSRRSAPSSPSFALSPGRWYHIQPTDSRWPVVPSSALCLGKNGVNWVFRAATGWRFALSDPQLVVCDLEVSHA